MKNYNESKVFQEKKNKTEKLYTKTIKTIRKTPKIDILIDLKRTVGTIIIIYE